MLIIFGTRGTSCPQKQTNEPCPCCGIEHKLTAVPYQSYLHIFWIPVFPAGRAFTMWCPNCEQEFDSDDLEPTKELRKVARQPLWTYVGTVLFAVLIFFIFKSVFSDMKTDRGELAQKIETPHVGDIYELELRNDRYTTMKVVSISADSVYFVYSQNDVAGKDSVSQLVRGGSDNYSEAVHGYSKTELRADMLTGSILNIRR